ncbi:MAG TPA: M23 family metallopeptidase, partial [Candidatus Baltobacteraceae bacterium]|nr:M23 family metallopeptidase [Candidatus Baltobacteraceae bacterium]
MNRTAAFLVLCALAALAACGQRTSPGSDLTPAVVRAPAFDDARLAHAPCAIVPMLHSPIKGTSAIVVAFGELRMNSAKTRYAFPGVEFAYHGGKRVLAATGGKATYLGEVSGLGQTIVIQTQSGVQTLYAGFAHPAKAFLKNRHQRVKPGETIALAGMQPLRFEYAPLGDVTSAGTQSNPCGSGSNAASGTISVMPADVAVYARFHTLSLDGTAESPGPYPSGSPDVSTPSNLFADDVVAAHDAVVSVYEHSDVFSEYYVVLCGNVVFAKGPARYAGPFPYADPTASPA